MLALIAALHEQTRGVPMPVRLESRLDADLGIDSLARVELGLRIEREFGMRLPDDALMQAATPADLQAALRAAQKRAPWRGGAPLATDVVAPSAVVPVAGVPFEAQTLLDVLAWHVARHPDRRHITFLASDEHSETLTYGELDASARRVAGGLVAHGLRPGQMCGLMLATGLDFFAVFYGILMAGAVPVPIYPPFRLAQLEDHMRRQARTLANCNATLLVSLPEARLLARLLKGTVPSLRHVVTPDQLLGAEQFCPQASIAAGDIAFLQYTSGSTGNPKGVMLTHTNVLANLRAMGAAAGATSSDIFMSWLPLYHDMGLIGAWMGSLYYGLQLVLMAPQAFLARPARWLWAVHRHRATITAAPNFAYELVASRIDEAEFEGLDLSSLRWTFNGAEAVSAATLQRFAQRFARHGFDPRTLAPVYGLAECSLDLAFPPRRRGVLIDHIDRDVLARSGRAVPVPASDPRAHPVVANGRVLPGYEIRIVDAPGRSLPERMQGRVEFRGPSATCGYFNNAEATAELFDGDWLDSGDLGYLADRELYVTGRAKDLIIRGGHNIHPYELEEAVGVLSGIRKGCV
ncbi:MAG: AMP-binding protein, partial [Gemmatimonadota bacterium]